MSQRAKIRKDPTHADQFNWFYTVEHEPPGPDALDYGSVESWEEAMRCVEAVLKEDEVVRPCVECGEETALTEPGYTFKDGRVMCSSCTHNAYRSGWNGEG